ncbi:MAG: ABC transporter permease, partial [Comamonadaceae bacterium]
MRNARQAPWALVAVTALVALFMVAPIALSVMAG